MLQWMLIAALSNPWSIQHIPSDGDAEAIGGYAAGCLQGAVALPLQGNGYQVLRPAQRRYYSHPVLKQYVLDLARQAKKAGLPDILVGDMAMAKGGPFSSGHRSHQTGLDTDIWFRFTNKKLTSAQLNNLQPVNMVNFKKNRVNASFTAEQATLLKLAAQDPRVERIFVNPPIKLAMCNQFKTGTNPWLGKLRPWFGHSAHFHVRLHCPLGSKDCEPQKPVPIGDGCGEELHSWLNHAATVSTSPQPNPMPALPGRCTQQVLKNRIVKK